MERNENQADVLRPQDRLHRPKKGNLSFSVVLAFLPILRSSVSRLVRDMLRFLSNSGPLTDGKVFFVVPFASTVVARVAFGSDFFLSFLWILELAVMPLRSEPLLGCDDGVVEDCVLFEFAGAAEDDCVPV